MSQNGLLIAIEGVDGVGKATQAEALRKSLVSDGHRVMVVDFPRYKETSSQFVREYLTGVYGNTDDISPYKRALFYAMDRFAASAEINRALDEGQVVICDRYAGSNMGFQGAAFDRAEERRGFFIWLDNLEYQLLGIPRPRLSIVLDASYDLISQRMAQKQQSSPNIKKDIHESNSDLLKKTIDTYRDLVQLFPKDFAQISCERNGRVLSPDVIAKLIKEKVEPLLPAPGQPVQSKQTISLPQEFNFVTPTSFGKEVAEQYQEQMNVLKDTYRQISEQLNKHLATNPNDILEAEDVLSRLIPVAASNYKLQNIDKAMESIVLNQLPGQLAPESKNFLLVEAMPRNELDLVAPALYAAANLPQKTINHTVADWTYEQKSEVISSLTPDSDVLSHAKYKWDLVTSVHVQEKAQQSGYLKVQRQQLTPRFGYSVPSIVERLDLTDLFEACFDLSLALFSHLQASGFEHEAQNAVLMGHKNRWSAAANLKSVIQLKSAVSEEPGLSLLANKLIESIQSVHPILGSIIDSR